MGVNFDNVPEMFSSSKEQKDTLKFDEKKEKLIQTAVERIKVTLRYGGHNLKKNRVNKWS